MTSHEPTPANAGFVDQVGRSTNALKVAARNYALASFSCTINRIKW
jgi:hypothetical protein